MTTADDVDMLVVSVPVEEDNHDEEMESGGGNGVMDLSWKNVTKNILTVIYVLYQSYVEKKSRIVESPKSEHQNIDGFQTPKKASDVYDMHHLIF